MTAQGTKLPEKRQQVCDLILKQIAGGLKNGDRLPTENHLSRKLGVGKSTARRALCDLAEKGIIEQQQGRGSFVANADHPQVRAFSLQAIRMVGFLSPFAHYEDGFMRDITLGADQAFDPRRFLMVTKHVHIPHFSESEVLPGLVHKVGGLLWLSSMDAGSRRAIARLLARRFPLVLVDRYLPDVACSSVSTDNTEVGLVGTRHLIGLGHRRILHLTKDEDITSTNERAEGYILAMKRSGLSPWIIRVRDMEDRDKIFARLTAAPKDLPSAIFCLNDSLAVAICQHLLQQRIAVPRDISVVGVDDAPYAAEFKIPMTTVAQPRHMMGFKAAHMLEDLMNDTAEPGTRLLLQPSLIIRASSAAPSVFRANT